VATTESLRRAITAVFGLSVDILPVTVVFVYGTLTDRTRVSELLSEYTFGPAAVCDGVQRVDGRYPTLIPGGQTTGRLLATTELDRLDGYEGVDRGLYCRVSIPVRSAEASEVSDRSRSDRSAFDVDTAEVYIGDPSALGVDRQVGWPDAENFSHAVTKYVEANSVRIVMKNHTDDH